MQQVVDLEGSPQFQSLGVALLSITTDSTPEITQAAQQWAIQTPILSDRTAEVSQSYGVMQWAHGREPGHTFVLVGKDGQVKWIQDYGAPQNGGLMYVEVAELHQEIAARL